MEQLTVKICRQCEMSLSVTEYHRNKATKDGLTRYCKSCSAVRSAESYLKHRESRMASALVYRERTRADCARRADEWRKADPARAAASQARYRRENPEKVAANLARWHAANPEKVKAHRVTRKGLVKNAPTVPFTGKQLAERMAYYGNRCWMCRGAFDHVDHVKPLSKGGSNMLSNLRPSCAFCNLSKNDKWFGAAELHRFIK